MSGVVRKTLVVGAFTGLSRILGFGREVLMAVFFGTTLAKSAFDVAFRIPNLLRRLFGEGALFAAFIPVFAETLDKEGRDSARRLLSRTMTLLVIATSMITVGGIVAATMWLKLGHPGERLSAVLPLLRIMLPYTVLVCVAALFSAALNAVGHFPVPAAAPMVLNGVVILVLCFVCPLFGDTPSERVFGVAWGVVVSGVIQMAIQIPVLLRHGLRPFFDRGFADRRVRQVLALMGPAAVGMGVVQMNVFVDGVLALLVGSWAPAALTYAERLIYMPLGVFATALGTVLLPTFSRQVSQSRMADMHRTINLALRKLTLVMMPAAVALCLLADPVVRLVYLWKGGMFGEDSVAYASRALAFYAPGLVVFSLYKVLVPVFYARRDTRTPIRVGVWAVLLNLCMNLVAVFTWPRGYEHAGMALATVIASAFNCAVLARIMHRQIGDPGWGKVLRSAGGVLMACVAMAISLELCIRILPSISARIGFGLKTGHLFWVGGSILIGAAVYTAAVCAFCREDVREVRAAIGWRRK